MPYFLSPIGNSQIVDANGDPLVGGTIETYLAGTSTPATTYTDDTGGTAQGVVMTLNSLGLPTLGPVWMLGGVPLKFIIKNALGVVQPPTYDDISGIGDSSTTPDQFPFIAPTPTYISATSFSFAGDQTNDAQIGRRIRSINTGGTIYSSITNRVFGAGITTVTVVNDSGVLDAGLSQVNYSLLTALTTAVPAIYAKTAEATATTTTGTSTTFVATPFPPIAGNAAPAAGLLSFHVAPTGTPTLAVSGFAALPLKYRDSAGALQTLTGFQCPINWRTPVYTDGTNWIVSSIAIPAPTSMVRLNTANGYGSTNTMIRRFGTVVTNQGADIVYADSATLGATFTIQTTGMYAISYSDQFSAVDYAGISLNSNQLTTAFGTPITAANVLAGDFAGTANRPACAAVTVYLQAGDVVRAHTNGNTSGTLTALSQFVISRVS